MAERLLRFGCDSAVVHDLVAQGNMEYVEQVVDSEIMVLVPTRLSARILTTMVFDLTTSVDFALRFDYEQSGENHVLTFTKD